MAAEKFVHLQCHSEYSLVDGLLKIKPWIARLAKLGMPAVAITDQSNLFGMVKFYQAALAAGIKPIVGSDVWLENEHDPANPFHLTLLCQNQCGYKNLTKLLSRSYTDGQPDGTDKPVIKREWLKFAHEGLIALAPSGTSDIAQRLINNDIKIAEQLITYWMSLFANRFYLCVSRTQRNDEQLYLEKVVQIAERMACPLVATNDVCFLLGDDFEAHEARVCIQQGVTLNDATRQHQYSNQQYLKSTAEMLQLFADIPQAIENTLEIAKRCNLILQFGNVFLPRYPVPKDMSTEDFLIASAKEGLKVRLAKILKDCPQTQLAQKRAIYQQRLLAELEVINNMSFAGYFLIVADFIRWAYDNNIPVGPGRGSGAGSLVSYVLQITDLDPIQYDLLFERFLNPERVSMPDFDIDFCMEGRDRVIEYVADRYGRDSVSQIITFGTMAARAVVRDVGRVLGHPYGFVDQIAKLVPMELGITLNRALEQEALLKNMYQKQEEVKTLIDLAKKLEGITRNVGKHAGGVVIAPSKLTNYTPLYCELGEQQLVTQFDKNDIETIGLVKFDFLGLRTLTIIKWALEIINVTRQTQTEQELNINTITLQDPKTFELLGKCMTTAVFQLESRGMKDLIRRLQPDCFEDIIALVALFRPGPLQSGMVDDFIDRKKGLASIKYLHPSLEPVLKSTYGVILYQEQVMQIAQNLAGYTLGAADLLRRAMGKKKPKEMAEQRAIFVTGAVKRGIDKWIAENIFNLIEKFAGYGFNKSHSAAYALIAYRTAWLKAHYPAAFMAAVLSSDMNNTDKIMLFLEECRALELTIVVPDINRSIYKFSVTADDSIIYGLGAIKGVGEAAINAIIDIRSQGKFCDLFNFCARVDPQKVTRRALEALIKAGALDSFGEDRASLMSNLELAIKAAEQIRVNKKYGQIDLFGDTLTAADIGEVKKIAVVQPWPEQIRLSREKEALGLYLTGHPLGAYEQELEDIGVCKIVNLSAACKKTCKIAGLIVNIRTILTKRGDRMAFVALDDCSGRQEMAVFADLFQTSRELLKKDKLIIVEGEASPDDYSGGIKFRCTAIMDLNTARADLAVGVAITVNHKNNANDNDDDDVHQVTTAFAKLLANILAKHPKGKCPILLHYNLPKAEVKMRLGKKWLVQPTDALLADIEELGADVAAEIAYIE